MWKECSPKVQASILPSIMVLPSYISKSSKKVLIAVLSEKEEVTEWWNEWGYGAIQTQTDMPSASWMLPMSQVCQQLTEVQRAKMNLKTHNSSQPLLEPPEAEISFWSCGLPRHNSLSLPLLPVLRRIYVFVWKLSTKIKGQKIGYTTGRHSNVWV